MELKFNFKSSYNNQPNQTHKLFILNTFYEISVKKDNIGIYPFIQFEKTQLICIRNGIFGHYFTFKQQLVG